MSGCIACADEGVTTVDDEPDDVAESSFDVSRLGEGVEGAGVGKSKTGLSRSTSGKKTSKFSSTVSTAGRIAQSCSSSRALNELRRRGLFLGLELDDRCPRAMSESVDEGAAARERLLRREDRLDVKSPGSPAAAARRPALDDGGLALLSLDDCCLPFGVEG